MSFESDESIFRFLFTSPAHFVGAADEEDFAITVVFPSFDHRSTVLDFQGPYARSRFMLSIRVPEVDKKNGVVVPMYTWVAEEASALLGGYFGKLVINLGHMQAGRFLTVPRTWDRFCQSHEKPPFNNQLRKPDGAELNLSQSMAVLRAYVAGSRDDKRLAYILRACEFYRMGLENYDERPEMAFTLLLSALESLVDLRAYSEKELYDEKLLADFQRIARSGPDGPIWVKDLKSRLYQVKRKVAALVNDYVPDSFFAQRETPLGFGFVKDRTELTKRVKAAYDIRSRLLHTGNREGIGHIAHEHQGMEFVTGTPVLPDSDLVKLLVASLNLTGLERVTSTVLRTAMARELIGKPATSASAPPTG